LEEQYKIETQQTVSEDNTLGQILDILHKIASTLKKYFILLLIPFIIAVLYSYKKIKDAPVTYTATISFSLSEDRPQISYGPATISQVQQGIAFSNPNKLREYSFTERVGSKLLFKKYYYNGQEDFLINHYLKTFAGYNESYFKKFTDVISLNTQEYSIFKRVLSSLRNVATIENNNADIYFIKVSLTDENFAILLCDAFYENLMDYYIERSTMRETSTLEFLEKRSEELRLELEKAEFNLAQYKDRANNLKTYKAELEEIKYRRDKQLVEKDFMESSMQLEIARTKLKNIAPLFQKIDVPHLPLPFETESRFKIYALNLAIAFVINFLVTGILVFRTYYWANIKQQIKTAQAKNESNTYPHS
jgi:hypothetical protein